MPKFLRFIDEDNRGQKSKHHHHHQKRNRNHNDNTQWLDDDLSHVPVINGNNNEYNLKRKTTSRNNRGSQLERKLLSNGNGNGNGNGGAYTESSPDDNNHGRSSRVEHNLSSRRDGHNSRTSTSKSHHQGHHRQRDRKK